MNSCWKSPEPFGWQTHVQAALQEDIFSGDITSATLDPSAQAEWYIEAQAEGIVCGTGIAYHLLGTYSKGYEFGCVDGDRVQPGTIICRGTMPAALALQYERTALNYIMHLSGIATLTHRFQSAVSHTKARIVDTRKTTPGLRHLQKYAVRCGGGHNHRMGLYDAVMIKDNHIRAHGSILKAVEIARSQVSHLTKIEVECDHPSQVGEAVTAGADVILLDNMLPSVMADVVQEFAGKAIFEASGGVNLDTVRAIAESGVDIISVGALTHSAPSLSVHMELS